MPPCVDVYALTDQRDRALIDRFLDRYGARPDPLAGGHTSSAEKDSATPAEFLDWIVGDPTFLGTVYLEAGARGVHGVLLHATRDGLLVLGVSIDEPDDWADALVAKAGKQRATRFMRQLVRSFPALCAGAMAEWPPPADRRGFIRDLASGYALASWKPE